MFDINAPEFLVLVVIAIVLFGPEKLPEFARKAARVLRYLRNIASNAQDQLSQELGPEFSDLDIRDLNPKTFVQKHLLDDIQPVVDDVKKEFDDVSTTGKSARDDVATAIGQKPLSPGGPTPRASTSIPAGSHAPFDLEAT
ncbi:sec-independent translocase [Microlunatus ginsengisoli]|uniref:Sec-independent translocase n=1 Tax=Microlunatus ginsengisoli TaxID=363863 RepID=A0ABP6ZST5_9ACTN